MTPTDEIDDPNWNDIFDRDKKIRDLSRQLDDIRSVLRWGSDEDVWPPGLTISESIARLIDRLDDAKSAIEQAPCEVAKSGEGTYECRVDKLCRVCKWRQEAIKQLW
jgi:hypothetical protein